MAPKRPSPLDDRPAGSSPEEEKTSSGEEDGDASTEATSSEEDEKVDSKPEKSAPLPSSASATNKKVASKKQDPPMNLKAQESSSETGSGSGSDSESESESESESNAEARKNVKPISWKPVEETPKHQKLRENGDITVRSSVKRPSQSSETKRAKKGSAALLQDEAVTEHNSKKTGDESKKLFQRLWSEEDEIVLLKGISDFTAKKGFEPPADMNDFHDFIKKYLHINVSRAQLRDKVWRLKKKYKNNVRRGKKGGDPTFTKAHEQKAFGLAKKVWGNEIETPVPPQPVFNGTTPRKSERASSSRPLKDKMDADGSLAPSECLNGLLDFNKNWGGRGLHEDTVKGGLELIQASKKAEFEEQWKKLHFSELELFVRRTELVRDQARLMLEAYKSSNK